ncbi:MAG: hypothetical protein M0015_01575 [Betaproteobacteria bacterium]|nr:hypothetical protein [Betaproteobacteria bacterium]
MAVLIEAICVVARRDAIAARLAGGWEAFVAAAAGGTLCADDELARVSFLSPREAEAFVGKLEAQGLRLEEAGRALDMAVVDQIGGFTLPCAWAEFGEVDTGGGKWVAACRRLGSTQAAIVTPEGWTYQGSLSQRTGRLVMGQAAPVAPQAAVKRDESER